MAYIKPKLSLYRLLQRKIFLFRSPWIDIIQFIMVIAAMVWFISISTSKVGYNWQWYRVPRFLFQIEEGRIVVGELINGLLFTLKISAISILLSLAIGLATALIRLSHSLMGRILSRLYLEIIRNTPFIVQIYLGYFVIGPIIGVGGFTSAVLALSLYQGAYLSEIFRAGIVSLNRGQWEAAYSLGLSIFSTYKEVILPQALRRILPPFTSQIITLIKNTALVSVVSLGDLAMQAQIVAAETFLTFEIWFTTALFYLAITIPLSTAVNYMEKRFKILT
jgi:polar amino acid transport system permease protein